MAQSKNNAKREVEGTSLNAIQMVQKTELEIADAVDGICRRHGLRYSLIFGSLLGAVRHRGFIPWDDDIDILMPREDYEKFLMLAKQELPDYFEVQCYKFGTSSRYVSRIADRRTLMHLDSYSSVKDMHIWFDIFVLDGLPDNVFLRWLQYLRVLWNKAACSFASFDETVNLKRPGRPKWQQFIINICAATHFGQFFNLKKNLDRYDQTLRRFPTFAYKSCFCGVGTYDSKRQTWPTEAFEDLSDYEFEGHTYLGPKDYDAVLSVTYGDYLAIPPVEQREVHQIHLKRHPLLLS